MKVIWYRIIAVAAILFAASLCSLPVGATGIALSPGNINIDSALRGSSYQNQFIILNSGDLPTDYRATVTGEAASWASLYYNGVPFTKVSLATGAQAICQIKISVPTDAPNGTHTATLVATSIPIEAKTGSGLSLSAQANIALNVTGTQIISGTVDSITTKDPELGSPLRIQVYLNNTGNVEIAPQINTEITYNNKLVDSVSYDKTTVAAGQRQPVIVEWDTTGNAPADYNAHVTISLDDGKTNLAEQNLGFKILPIGTLTRSGDLTGITLEGRAVAGFMSKVDAVFKKTGQMDVMAQFTGEVYLNGNLINTIQSDKLLIYNGTQQTLSAYFQPDKPGNYNIKGFITYEGKKTETKELPVNAISVQTQSNSSSNMLLYIVAAVALILLVVAVFMIRKSRKKDKIT